MSCVRLWELIASYFLENRDVDRFIVVLEFLWSESLLSPVESAESEWSHYVRLFCAWLVGDNFGTFGTYLEIIDASRRFNIFVSGSVRILKSRAKALLMVIVHLSKKHASLVRSILQMLKRF